MRSSDSHHSSQRCRACCQCIQLKSSSLLLSFTATLQSGSSPSCSFSLMTFALKCTSAWTFHHREIFECAHLKFTVSGWSKQTNKHRYTRNAVTLVWGSLRLAPIIQVYPSTKLYWKISRVCCRLYCYECVA